MLHCKSAQVPSSTTLYNSHFIDNAAADAGTLRSIARPRDLTFGSRIVGALYSDTLATVFVYSSSFLGNTASDRGGALLLSNNPNATIVNSFFVNNNSSGADATLRRVASPGDFLYCV